jgi:hypothetical protein
MSLDLGCDFLQGIDAKDATPLMNSAKALLVFVRPVAWTKFFTAYAHRQRLKLCGSTLSIKGYVA